MTWVNNNTPPACFGKSWEQQAPECAGGPDAAFTDENGGHIRPACGFFNACGSRTQAAKMEESQKNLVPATSLVRAWQGRPTQVQNPQPVGGTQQGIQQFTQQQYESMQKQAMQQMQAQMQAQMAAWQRGQGQAPMMMPPMMGMPPPGYQQMMPVNFEIPQYLTHREYRRPDEGLFRVLGREVARSMLKSAGHTFANFFDSTPFFTPPKKE